MTIIGRWNFSWDLNPGPPQKFDGGDNSSWQTWRYSSGKRKSSKISQRRCISTPDIAISALSQHPCVFRPAITLLFRSKPLSLPKELYRNANSNQFPFIFAATFNGVIRRKLKPLANTNVVIIAHFSQNYQTVWVGSPQTPIHSRLWYCRISSKTVYSATQNCCAELFQ